MKIIVFLTLCHTLVYGQKEDLRKLLASNEKSFINLQEKYSSELKCLKRIDAILGSKWTQDLNKIPTEDLGLIEGERILREPNKPMYNTVEQEWLMESGSTARTIDSCIREVILDIVPLMNQGEINCLNSVFASHIEEEYVHEEIFEDTLKTEAREQLPFRRFVSFTQFVELMFQSRTPDALGDLERVVYEHAESYLTTEMDRVDSTYIMEQECEWKNARALREAPNSNAKFDEFVRQVRDLVNQQVANKVVKEWNLSSTLPRDKYLAWLNVRKNMTAKINAEVRGLRDQQKDVQWLCERANKFAYELSDQEVKILIGTDESQVDLEVSEVAKKARGIEQAMKRTQDFRHPVLKTLAEKYENGTRCFSSFLHLVQNHRRFDIALAFVDEEYNYPQFYCKAKNHNLGLIATRFCKCVGSFCVHHPLAALFAEEYALEKGPDGVYRVVLSGVKSREKVQNWDNRD